MTASMTKRWRLAGPGLSEPELARLAGLAGVTQDGAADDPLACLVPEGDTETLRAVIAGRQAHAVVEVAGNETAAVLAAALGAGGFQASLCTRTAWSLDTAAVFCDGLLARDLLPDYLRHDVELSLHEAVINAVLHGNLAMGSSLVDDPAEFEAFCRRLSATLEDPDKAGKRVGLTACRGQGHLSVAVQDQGAGFDPALVRPSRLESKSGRGLEIMRTMASDVTIEDGGRRVTLIFSL